MAGYLSSAALSRRSSGHRGFGASTPMPRDFRGPSTPHCRFRAADGFRSASSGFHLVGAKIGGTIARAFAARRGERVMTLTVLGTPPPMRKGAAERAPDWPRNSSGTGSSTGRAGRWRVASAAPSQPKGSSGGSSHGPYRGLDANRFHEDDRLRRHQGGSAKIRCPNLSSQRMGAGSLRRPTSLATADPEFDASGPARQLLPRRGEPCGALCRRDARFHRPEQRRLNPGNRSVHLVFVDAGCRRRIVRDCRARSDG